MATGNERLLRMQQMQAQEQQGPEVPTAEIRVSPRLLRMQQMQAQEVPPEQPQAPQEQGGFGQTISNIMAYPGQLISGESQETDESRGLPEFSTTPGVTTGDFGNDLKIAASNVFVMDPEARKDIIKANFPGVKIYDDKKGNTIIELPDGRKTLLNKPGFSSQDAMGLVGTIASYWPSTKLAGLIKPVVIKGVARPVATRVAGAAALDYATDQALQAGERALGSEQEISQARSLIAGVTGGLAETVGPAVRGLSAGRKAKKLGVDIADYEDALRSHKQSTEISEDLGVDFSRAQQTRDITDLHRASKSAESPGGGAFAMDFLEKQSRDLDAALYRKLDALAPAENVGEAAANIRDASALILKGKMRAIQKEAAPLYKEAFRDTSQVSLPKTDTLIREQMAKFGAKSPKGKAIRIAKGAIEDVPKGGSRNLEFLDSSKKTIDDAAREAKRAGQSELKGELDKVRRTLMDEVDKVGKVGDELSPYAKARAIYSSDAPAVKKLENGFLGRLASTEDMNLERIPSQIFGEKGTLVNPAKMQQIRKEIEAVNPQLWRDITRTQFEIQLSKVSSEVGESKVIENIPAQLHAKLFGNSARKNVMYAAMDPETAKSFRYLEQGLKRAKVGRPGGSQTDIRKRLADEDIKGIRGAIGNFLMNPREAGVSGVARLTTGMSKEARQRVRERALAKVMFDPKWKPHLEELRKVNSGTQRAGAMLKGMLDKSLSEFGKPAAQILNPEN